jgi:hypothetical protein
MNEEHHAEMLSLLHYSDKYHVTPESKTYDLVIEMGVFQNR